MNLHFEAHLFVTRWPGSRCDGRDWFRQQCERFSSREKTACLVSERSGWVRIWILLETVQIGHFRVSTNLCFKARLIQSFWSETHASKTHLHKKGSALSLVLKVRVFIIMTNESIELIPFAWILNPTQSQHMRPKLNLQLNYKLDIISILPKGGVLLRLFELHWSVCNGNKRGKARLKLGH